jgi:Spy/CpxP family protein refolding chaperone
MGQDKIDWGRSIEQQIEEIIAVTATARKLVRQIKHKRDAHPELITKESYTYFQSVIHSMAQLRWEVEESPLYKEALMELRNRQKRKQQRTVAKYFGNILS